VLIVANALRVPDIIGWPQARCSFPEWISRTEWRDLDGRTTYTVGASSGGTADVIRLSVLADVTSPLSSPTVTRSFRCLRSNDDAESSVQSYVAMMFVSAAW
jgi:hypothetical protein